MFARGHIVGGKEYLTSDGSLHLLQHLKYSA